MSVDVEGIVPGQLDRGVVSLYEPDEHLREQTEVGRLEVLDRDESRKAECAHHLSEVALLSVRRCHREIACELESVVCELWNGSLLSRQD